MGSWDQGIVALELDPTILRSLDSSLPLHDWQFWVATAIFLGAAMYLFRNILPIPYLSKRRRARRTTKRVTLTVGGRPAAKDSSECDRCGE